MALPTRPSGPLHWPLAILLKLYAGGTQDIWDIRELLRVPGAEQLVADVEGALREQPAVMRDLWLAARKP